MVTSFSELHRGIRIISETQAPKPVFKFGPRPVAAFISAPKRPLALHEALGGFRSCGVEMSLRQKKKPHGKKLLGAGADKRSTPSDKTSKPQV